MKLSKRCEYGLKAAVRLASRHGGGYVQSRDIADHEALPAKFLESILLSLRSASILESKVGAGGGYRLTRPPAQISVRELIDALDRVDPSEDSNGVGRGGITPGGVVLDELHGRIEQAMTAAVGSLSLADLYTIAEDHAPARGSDMYYV
jgi:Rrf2 family protein